MGHSSGPELRSGTRSSVYDNPFIHDFEVTGTIELVVFAAADGIDTEWTAKLLDVVPDGTE